MLDNPSLAREADETLGSGSRVCLGPLDEEIELKRSITM